ncbi:pentatricopeptide repeat-containing protein [Pyrus ussuriensis x Pyrus communis]|uniref:Pentatricopeptide repeat-containing protein n=1 Tax=Pyrus ussuriensis x Pyrus communis TaxID=2448454 RepID=A0A5N5IAJ8_9ROSA|nr:pentatricopeptide repeat-containing protein [Pyrus ussuriensis x Pyrus communis]KAB2636313.1 pentatricopeptide repeat-containing protein [Pyrus ussuriensis x Pyrus communis]
MYLLLTCFRHRPQNSSVTLTCRPNTKKQQGVPFPFSIRTCSSVFNSCPMVATRLEGVPCSIEELNGVSNGDEGMVVKELVGSTVLQESMVWESLEAKLDLHGLHLGSLYLIMLEWFEAMRHKFNCGECRLGKHNSVRGELPVKVLVKVMMQEV